VAEEVEFRIMHIPTRFRFPLWARRNSLTLKGALERLKISDISVRRISVEFRPRNLIRPYLFPHLPASLSPRPYLEILEREAPVDGTEIVEWMRIAAVDNAILSARKLEYERAGSEIEAASGDGYIPGISVASVRYVSEYASRVRSRGYAVAQTPRGNFDVPLLRKRTGVFKDLLTYGSMSYCGAIQWGGPLVFWRDLASTPIRQTVGFIMDARGNQAPHFFEQLPLRPAISVTVRQRFSSEDAQTITINFRDPTDYTRVLGTREIDVAEGESEVSWTMRAFPYVPPVVAEIQPQDNVETSMEEYVVV